jgi:hypothetical protein
VRKITVILMMFFLSLGLTQPTGCMQYFNLHEMYAQCSVEDHDITPLDFVFEHLLNLESIVNIFEGEHEYQMGDHPHEPMQTSQAVAHIQLALPNVLRFEVSEEHPVYREATTYPICKGPSYSDTFCGEILRPPIAA